MKRVFAFCLAIAVAAVCAPAALAAPVVDGVFDLPDQPQRVALGPDGNMWVTIGGSNVDYVRITPAGVVTPFDDPDPNAQFPVGITAGPDGNMWVTVTNGVVKFSPATPTAGTFTSIVQIGSKQGIVTGPDGNLWTASDANIVRIPPANPAGKVAFPVLTSGRGIAAATDGTLWAADFLGQNMVNVTTAGVATPYPVGGGPQEVAGGPGGQILYSNPGLQNVGLLSPGGTPQLTGTPLSDPFGITFGQDGAYWIAQFASNDVGRLTTGGQYTTLPGIPAASGPRHIATGPGGTIWVTLEASKQIARISGVEPPATGDTTKPVISGLGFSKKTFRVGKNATKIRFMLSEPASVKLIFERLATGKLSGKKCVKPRKSLKKKKNCKRVVSTKSMTTLGVTGANSLTFDGKVGKSTLKPGEYQLGAIATDPAGNASTTGKRPFKILPKRKKH